ncbi:MAG TPA: imidazolonepropionase [Polyangiaceae bacterium]|nr:imidazolonepropionase [Polyangiaceae bacterium]
MSAPAFVVAAGRVVTCDDALGLGPLGAIDDGAVLVERGRVAAVGPRREVLARAAGAPLVDDVAGGLLSPGLVDAHTHAAWAGSRHDEYAMRLAGEGYEAIAAAGGGIVATMRAVRAARPAELAAALRARLGRMARQGVTTVEVKSGYGLDEASERAQLEAAADAAGDPSLPRVVPTYLALHALPPEAKADRARYVGDVVGRWLPAIARAGLARYVDAYVDRNAFRVDEAEALFAAARLLGLGVRAHAGQFADVGGAELAARNAAASADHLEHVSDAGLDALARAGTAAVLLPVASFTLGQAPPPVAAMRRAGVRLVVASDANPGTAPTESLPLALAFAARLYGLSDHEALRGATAEAARSLGLEGEVGVLREGARADLALWLLPHERALLQPWGAPPLRAAFRDGVRLG